MIDLIISRIEKLPQEFLTPKEIVDLGLYTSLDSLYSARYYGVSPDYIKVNRKIIYPKVAVIEFIKQNFKIGSKRKVKKD